MHNEAGKLETSEQDLSFVLLNMSPCPLSVHLETQSIMQRILIGHCKLWSCPPFPNFWSA